MSTSISVVADTSITDSSSNNNNNDNNVNNSLSIVDAVATPQPQFMLLEDSLVIKTKLLNELMKSDLIGIKDLVLLIHSYIISPEWEISVGSRIDCLDTVNKCNYNISTIYL